MKYGFALLLMALCLFLCAAAAEGSVLDIETVWALEDSRAQTDTPLTTRLLLGDAPLGYDAGSNTFYCTLGMETGSEWPELSLQSAQEGIGLGISDDYRVDDCRESIAQGTAYELLLWDEERLFVSRIVFTGLPIVTLHTDGGAAYNGHEDLETTFTLSAAGQETVISGGLSHLRGGGYRHAIDKLSYRVELYDGDKKAKPGLLGMPADSDWLLLGNASDDTTLANPIAWRLWREWMGDGCLTPLVSEQVELFVNDRYEGVYQLSQRISPKRELKAQSWKKKNTVVFRMITAQNDTDRLHWSIDALDGRVMEVRYQPEDYSEEAVYAVLQDFCRGFVTHSEMDDAAFSQWMLERFDMEELISFYLFTQVTDNYDSVVNGNNIYLWARKQKDGTWRYSLSPWDMDASFRLLALKTEEYDAEQYLEGAEMITRALDLDLGGSREILWRLYREKAQGELCGQRLMTWLDEGERLIADSGAAARELERWYPDSSVERSLSTEPFRLFTAYHIEALEGIFAARWPLEP